MKYLFVIYGIVIFSSLSLFAQTPAKSVSKGNNNIDQMGIHWDGFENHPMRALKDSAILLNADYISIIDAEHSNDFYRNKAAYLLKLELFSKYELLLKNAKDEFERRKVEKLILADYTKIKLMLHKKRFLYFGLLLNFSEYSFTANGFSIHEKSRDFLNKYLTTHKIKVDPDLNPVPNVISVGESFAEQFVHDNSTREVTAYGIIDLWSPDKYLKFVAFTYMKPNVGEQIISVYPNAETISQQIEELSVNISEENKTNLIESTDIGIFELSEEDLITIDNRLAESARFHMASLYAKCKEIGLDKSLSEDAKQIIIKYASDLASKKAILSGVLKVGRQFNGYQLYPNNIKKNIIIRFDRKEGDFDRWWGTCTYSNGKKAIVQACLASEDKLGLLIEFYMPNDDEQGASEGNLFLLENNKLIGYQMNEKVYYGKYAKTGIYIK